MTQETTSKKVDDFLYKIVDMSYEELKKFKEWRERFVNKWNSLPNAQQITVRTCEDDFFKRIYQSGLCPTPGGIETNFKTPEEAAELVMNYIISKNQE